VIVGITGLREIPATPYRPAKARGKKLGNPRLAAVAPASTTQDEYVAPSGLLSGPVEPAKTVPVEPTLTLLVEPTQTAPVEPAQTTPVETTVPVETTQTVFVQSTIQNRQPVRLRTNAWAKALEKLHKRKTAAREAASETERHAEFNHFWDNLTSIPSPSASSGALSHVKPDEPAVSLRSLSTLQRQQHATSHRVSQPRCSLIDTARVRWVKTGGNQRARITSALPQSSDVIPKLCLSDEHRQCGQPNEAHEGGSHEHF
jgi:hypothetical protein